MNHAANAYATASKTGLSGRELEASLLIRAAAQLQSVRDDWDARKQGLDEALAYNRKLWTVLATAATEPDNPLPEPVKQDLSRLAVFIFKRTLDLMIEPDAAKVEPLISINRNVAAGLREPARAA
jgi:flagellar protein FlaF